MDAHLALQRLARIAAGGFAGFALASAQSQDLAADAAITVFAQRYVVTGLAIDDLDVLERYVLDLHPPSATLYMCGPSGRAARAAAHRLRRLPLQWVVLETMPKRAPRLEFCPWRQRTAAARWSASSGMAWWRSTNGLSAFGSAGLAPVDPSWTNVRVHPT